MSITICAPVHTEYTTAYAMDPAYRPALPRRTSSAPHRLSDVSPSPPSTSARVVVHPPTPPQPQRTHTQTRQEQEDDEQSTSSDGSQPTILRRRGRHPNANASPPQATPSHLSASMPAPTCAPIPGPAPAPTSTPKLADAQTASTKGRQSAAHIAVPAPKSAPALHLSATPGPIAKPPAGIAKSHSGSSIPAPTPTPAAPSGPMVRSKSGQPLKSSLKSSTRPALSVITRGAPSRSAPSTPTLKSVHFDAQLARVRLFLAGQRPRAVSRDGSPTDTSGTESEFPSFIYGRGEGGERLVMEVLNMPRGKRMEADVALEEMQLAPDGGALHGRVRVRNLAFEKRLAVRFTFDAWQTTSEVAARYVESPADTRFDVFGFTIRLNDILARIEGKSLLLALRYSVAGREIWDNNGGQNYLARFSRKPVPAPVVVAPPPPKMIPSDSEDEGSGRAIGHLKSKLEQFAQARAEPPAAFAPTRPPALQAMSNARYDFAAALKQNAWVPAPVPPRHTRTHTYPAAAAGSPPNPNTIPFPQKRGAIVVGLPSPRASALGSPALEDALARQAEAAALAKEEGAPFVARRHTRGYFDRSVSADSGAGGGVKRTPAGSPRDLTPPERCNSFPPREGLGVGAGAGWPVAVGGSEESTPAMTSPSGSSRASSRTPSPTEEHGSLTTRRAARELSPGGSPQGGDHYSSFLNRFCFYTGPDAKLGVGVGEEIPRSHSASSVEAFLMHTPPAAPTRSPSFDELASRRSGSTTPTAGRLSDSRSPTPVAG
ncbi:hypothetical protein HWV62_21038 [Athelia sp. TMB]|nr:hypothetical protein HWV62_21038 [Athelia sp. TMB]